MKARNALAAMLILCILLPGLAGTEKAGSRVWLLQEGEILEYDPLNWTVINSIPVPKEISRDPERLQITRTGEMLFCLDAKIAFADPGRHFAPDKAWIWNGKASSVLDRQFSRKSVSAGGERAMVSESNPQLSLSGDGRQLFWFANESTILRREDGADLSASTSYRIWQTNLGGGNPSQIASFAFPACKCETGVCPETCPEANVTFSEDGAGDFFIVGHLIPGQLGTDYQASFLYQKAGGQWSKRKLNRTFEYILDAAQSGNTVIHAVRDDGCCGWENESSDQTIATTAGRSVVLFDEWRRYSNQDYDVSFYTSKAKQSPNGLRVALNISSTAPPNAKIRLSNNGKANPAELDGILKTMAILPAVEVFRIGDPSKPLVSLPHATFAGWLNDNEILAVENGALFVFNVSTGARKPTDIKVPGESSVFVR